MHKAAAARRLVSLSVIAMGLAACAASLSAFAADDYPSRPVRIVVPYPAGGSVDPPARVLAEQLSQQTGRQFIVDNKPGAGGNIGADFVAGAAADGYTLLFAGSNITISPALMKETTRFNPNTSFTHVGRVVTLATAFVVNSSSRFRSLGDLLAYARANPGKLTYGVPGTGSPSQLAMELLKRSAGVDIRGIPYKGSANALTDLLGDQVDIVPTVVSGPMGQIKAGRMRALAVSSARREPQLPDVPTVSESVPGFELVTWLGISAPRGLPPEVEARLSMELERALNDPVVAQSLRAGGMTPAWTNGRQMAAMVRTETEVFANLIEAAKIKGE